MPAFFFFVCAYQEGISWTQAFVVNTVETGDKNRDVSQRHALLGEKA